jgi:uncharacterized protein
LIAWPDADNWVMRLSVADIERDGSFSAFPGVDRWFAVLAGNGVRLGASQQVVVAGDAPVYFDGAAAPACTLIDGPTRDLNLMIRRDAAAGWMKRVASGVVREPSSHVPDATNDLFGVFVLNGCTLHRNERDAVDLPAMSLAWSTDVKSGECWRVSGCDSDHATLVFQCTQPISETSRNV